MRYATVSKLRYHNHNFKWSKIVLKVDLLIFLFFLKEKSGNTTSGLPFILIKCVVDLKDIQLHSIKKNAFCLKTSRFINKYDSPRSQLCQWPRLVHNCNQSFNMAQAISVLQ